MLEMDEVYIIMHYKGYTMMHTVSGDVVFSDMPWSVEKMGGK